MSSFLHEELESKAPQGGNRGEERVPPRFDLFPGLGSNEEEGFGDLGLGKKMRGGELEQACSAR